MLPTPALCNPSKSTQRTPLTKRDIGWFANKLQMTEEAKAAWTKVGLTVERASPGLSLVRALSPDASILGLVYHVEQAEKGQLILTAAARARGQPKVPPQLTSHFAGTTVALPSLLSMHPKLAVPAAVAVWISSAPLDQGRRTRGGGIRAREVLVRGGSANVGGLALILEERHGTTSACGSSALPPDNLFRCDCAVVALMLCQVRLSEGDGPGKLGRSDEQVLGVVVGAPDDGVAQGWKRSHERSPHLLDWQRTADALSTSGTTTVQVDDDSGAAASASDPDAMLRTALLAALGTVAKEDLPLPAAQLYGGRVKARLPDSFKVKSTRWKQFGVALREVSGETSAFRVSEAAKGVLQVDWIDPRSPEIAEASAAAAASTTGGQGGSGDTSWRNYEVHSLLAVPDEVATVLGLSPAKDAKGLLKTSAVRWHAYPEQLVLRALTRFPKAGKSSVSLSDEVQAAFKLSGSVVPVTSLQAALRRVSKPCHCLGNRPDVRRDAEPPVEFATRRINGHKFATYVTGLEQLPSFDLRQAASMLSSELSSGVTVTHLATKKAGLDSLMVQGDRVDDVRRALERVFKLKVTGTVDVGKGCKTGKKKGKK